jgi:hypothetical protein
VKREECARGWEADALREGLLGLKDGESFVRHCRTCGTCASHAARDGRLRRLGKALPVPEPTLLELRRLRARVLRSAVTGATGHSWRSWRNVAAVATLTVAVAGLAGQATWRARSAASRPAPSSETVGPLPTALTGEVVANDGAAWRQSRDGGLEKVDLSAGTIRVHVRPQGSGERFFVLLPDGEIEVRGTTFAVTVVNGATRKVDVDAGTVILRLRGASEVSLVSGARWAASEARAHEVLGPTKDVAPAPGPSIATADPRSARVRPRDESGRKGDDGSAVYVDAMRLLRDGHYDRAAEAFHAYILAYPGGPEAEDSFFLEAVALAREGRTDAAALAAERYLGAFPRPFHGRDASILVARAAGRRGHCKDARAVLARASGADDVEVRSALQPCDEGSVR